MKFSATEAKNRFGHVLEQARRAPGERFYRQYKAWVDAQNGLVRDQGVFGEGWRSW